MANQARGNVEINTEECKGCGLCVESCPPDVLELAPDLNAYGVHPAVYKGENCTGCGICFYCCPEPGAITVFRAVPGQKAAAAAEKEIANAATL
ncbi:MAG TPA: ferredoxin family protein [Clostridia bacterium]|nr:ferredoxin family protein [Clostridia bacterium]